MIEAFEKLLIFQLSHDLFFTETVIKKKILNKNKNYIHHKVAVSQKHL